LTRSAAPDGKGEHSHRHGDTQPADDGPRRPRLLFVDDDAYMRRLVSARLERLGAQVETAVSAQACLEALADRRPDVIISDAVMPVMDGFDLCRRIRADPALRSIPFVILTALTRDLRSRSLQAGADDYLSKLEHEVVFRLRVRLAFQLGLCRSGQAGPEPSAEPANLLVVSESSAVQTQMDTHLQREGIQTRSVGTLAQALQRLQVQVPDFLVLDLAYGQKAVMDWAMRLRTTPGCEALPVMALAAKEDDAWLAGMEHHIQDRLSKPLESQESRHRVNLLLRIARR